jgi:dethiobiotin synthetase
MKIIFVTGTDTGVGKTVLTALLLAHLRGQGINALAMKPFCSGPRDDAEILHALEKQCLTLEDVNPFYFDRPVAPLAAARMAAKSGRKLQMPSLQQVIAIIKAVGRRCETLLIEGSGGLLVPLGARYTVADLIAGLQCSVIVVARNRLGTINHTLLTIKALDSIGKKEISVVLMSQKHPDASAGTNLEILVKMAPKTRCQTLPYLGSKPLQESKIKKDVTFLKKTLAQIAACVSLCAVLSQ